MTTQEIRTSAPTPWVNSLPLLPDAKFPDGSLVRVSGDGGKLFLNHRQDWEFIEDRHRTNSTFLSDRLNRIELEREQLRLEVVALRDRIKELELDNLMDTTRIPADIRAAAEQLEEETQP